MSRSTRSHGTRSASAPTAGTSDDDVIGDGASSLPQEAERNSETALGATDSSDQDQAVVDARAGGRTQLFRGRPSTSAIGLHHVHARQPGIDADVVVAGTTVSDELSVDRGGDGVHEPLADLAGTTTTTTTTTVAAPNLQNRGGTLHQLPSDGDDAAELPRAPGRAASHNEVETDRTLGLQSSTSASRNVLPSDVHLNDEVVRPHAQDGELDPDETGSQHSAPTSSVARDHRASSRRVNFVRPAQRHTLGGANDNMSWRSISSSSSQRHLPESHGPSANVLRLLSDLPYPQNLTMPHTAGHAVVQSLAKAISSRFARRVPSAARAPNLNQLLSGRGADEERKRHSGSVKMATTLSRIYAIALPVLHAHSLFELTDDQEQGPSVDLPPATPVDMVSDMASLRSSSSSYSQSPQLEHGPSHPSVPHLPYQAQLWLALYNIATLALGSINTCNMEILAASNELRSKQSRSQGFADLQSAFTDGQSGYLAGTNIRIHDADAMEDRLVRRLKLQRAIRDSQPSTRPPRRTDNRNRGRNNRNQNTSSNRPTGSNLSTKDMAQGRPKE